MSLLLSGSDGLSDVDGTAATPAIRGTDANTGISFGTDTVTISTGGVARVTTDASGNVGIGATPSAWGAGFSAIDLGAVGNIYSSSGGINILTNAYFNGTNFIYKTTNTAYRYGATTGAGHIWLNAPSGTAGNTVSFTQAMTLDASGNLLVGTTSQIFGSLVTFRKNGGNTLVCQQDAGSNAAAIVARVDITSGRLVGFNYAGTDVGTITTNGTTTAYNTSSDYRLKENVAPMQNA
jgi:hypothetical protein